MKRTILLSLLVALTMGAAAQRADTTRVENDTTQSEPYDWPVTIIKPQFPGGDEALKKFLKKNVNYPEAAVEYGVEGRVIMSFIVDIDGSIQEVSAYNCQIERFNTSKFSQETESKQNELKKQFAKLFAKEAYRVIKKMPKWTPGSDNGQIKRMKIHQPIHFSLPDK